MFDMARSDRRAGALLDGWLDDAGLYDDAALFTNRVAQPAIVAATLATWTALGDIVPAPALVAGYSIGELAALGVAGALDPRDAVLLAGERARLMDACRAGGPAQTMVALSGLTVSHAEDILQPFGFHVAIVTGDDSFVAGGPADRSDALAIRALASGAHATMLPVEIASHTPFMRAAVASFQVLLAGQKWRHRIWRASLPRRYAGRTAWMRVRSSAPPWRWSWARARPCRACCRRATRTSPAARCRNSARWTGCAPG